MKKSLRKKLERLAERFAIYADEALDGSLDHMGEGRAERAWLKTAANLAAASAQVSMALSMPKCYAKPLVEGESLGQVLCRGTTIDGDEFAYTVEGP